MPGTVCSPYIILKIPFYFSGGAGTEEEKKNGDRREKIGFKDQKIYLRQLGRLLLYSRNENTVH